jgi:hypothetical protein
MRNTNAISRAATVLAAAAIAIVPSSCGAPVDQATTDTAEVAGNRPGSTTAPTPAAEESTAVDYASPDLDEVENFVSFKALAGSADLVVLGSVAGVEPGPVEGADEVQTATARLLVQPSDVLRGDKGAITEGQVRVAVVLGDPRDAVKLEQGLRASLPQGDAIWVLRSLDDVYPGVYRLVTLGSIVEPASDGTAESAWYRGIAARVRAGELDATSAARPVEQLAIDLSQISFKQAIEIARDA